MDENTWTSVAILGFGRSGTTWISDIVSKVTGRLVLFEPLHPAASALGKRFTYSRGGAAATDPLAKYLDDVLGGRVRAKWLLRNHLPVALDEVSEEFVDAIWRECAIAGFKEIRANFMIPWIARNLDVRIVFVMRHPLAVMASLKRRVRFFEEFGWDEHAMMFVERVFLNEEYSATAVPGALRRFLRARTDLERWAIMWAATHAVALADLACLGLPVFHYERFYEEPYAATRDLLRFLGCADLCIHPSHLFVPSMTTNRTLHGLRDGEERIAREGASLFWEGVLTREEIDSTMEIVQSFGIRSYSEDCLSGVRG